MSVIFQVVTSSSRRKAQERIYHLHASAIVRDELQSAPPRQEALRYDQSSSL